MKTCYSCSSKPTRNGVYKSELQEFIFSQLPKDNKHYHKQMYQEYKGGQTTDEFFNTSKLIEPVKIESEFWKFS